MKVSASQITNFLICPRLWYFKSVLKEPEPFNEAFKAGNEIHACIEDSFLLLENKEPKKEIHPPHALDIVREAFLNGTLYKPQKYLVEHKIDFNVMPDVDMTGFIDLIDVTNSKIIDHKSISKLEYAETPETIKKNLQLLIYAYWYINKLNKDKVWVRHNQLVKNAPETSRFVEAQLTSDEVIDYWKSKVLPAIKLMKFYKDANFDKQYVPCDIDGCSKYGGCYVERKCKS